ncbi:MAG TPA: PT domain-containing protein [Anaerolineae bacterium]|nr:PT domain-containing protein [Anaerolineae bacterium]
MKLSKLLNPTIVIAILLTACAPITAPGQPTTQPSNQPSNQPTPLPDSEAPSAALAARQVLAQQRHIDLNEIAIVSAEKVEWPDGCLGVSIEGSLCTQVITPGYRVILEAEGERYEYHTDESGGNVILASAPEPNIEDVAIEWTRADDGPCQAAQIGGEQVAFGVCNGPMMPGRLIAELDRPSDLAYFVETYASFEATTPAGKVTFTGQGATEATEAEQRMIAEFARLAVIEAAGGRSGAAYGLALAWRREGGFAGFCDDVSVYVTGVFYATSCKGNQPQDLGRSRLTADQLEQMFEWVDTFSSFEINQTDPATADAMTIRLVFSGAGAQEPTDADKQAIQDFAAQLFTQLKK